MEGSLPVPSNSEAGLDAMVDAGKLDGASSLGLRGCFFLEADVVAFFWPSEIAEYKDTGMKCFDDGF